MGTLGRGVPSAREFLGHSISWSAGVGGQCTGTAPTCQLVPELVARHLPLKDAVKTTATTGVWLAARFPFFSVRCPHKCRTLAGGPWLPARRPLLQSGRRERRLRSWWRHEQQRVAMALSAAAHHSFDEVAAGGKYDGLRAQRTDRAGEAANRALRRQKSKAAGEAVFFELFDEDTAGWRPAPVLEPLPQDLPQHFPRDVEYTPLVQVLDVPVPQQMDVVPSKYVLVEHVEQLVPQERAQQRSFGEVGALLVSGLMEDWHSLLHKNECSLELTSLCTDQVIMLSYSEYSNELLSKLPIYMFLLPLDLERLWNRWWMFPYFNVQQHRSLLFLEGL